MRPVLVCVWAYVRESIGPTTCVVLLAGALPAFWAFTVVSLLVVSAITTPTAHRRNVILLDLGLILFYVSSVASTVFAYDIQTALPQLQLRTLFLLLYLALRSPGRINFDIVTASELGMIVRCGESLAAFSRSYREWIGLQFTSLVDFRSSVTLTLHGEKPGNYAAIYIAALALGIYGLRGGKSIGRVKMVIFMVSIGLSAMCVLFSFSRSLYVCSALCIVLSMWGATRKVHFRKRIVVASLAATLVIITAGVLCVRPITEAIGSTVLWRTRLSQERSTTGRLSINLAAMHLATQSGLLGAGVSNYALEVRRRGLTSPSLLTAHAFNTVLEVGIEQGIIGFAALFVILAGVTRIIVKRFRTGRGKAFLGGSAGLLLYSMSQTFVIADQATATLLAVFCTIAVQDMDRNA